MVSGVSAPLVTLSSARLAASVSRGTASLFGTKANGLFANGTGKLFGAVASEFGAAVAAMGGAAIPSPRLIFHKRPLPLIIQAASRRLQIFRHFSEGCMSLLRSMYRLPSFNGSSLVQFFLLSKLYSIPSQPALWSRFHWDYLVEGDHRVVRETFSLSLSLNLLYHSFT